MSTSYSDLPSFHGEHMTFRQATRDRLLNEMLGSAKANDSKSTYKVLIMDKFTVKIMSHSCKMTEITDQGFPLVEDIYKRRQPMPSMDAVYFIQPSLDNVVMFVSDMSGGCPLYRKAYVFFSSAVPKQCLAHIKSDKSVLSRIGALSEMNLEYLTIDSQAFLTDHERALEEIFAENAEKSKNYNACLDTMAERIATVFASLREFPYVRYRDAMCSADATTAITLRDLIPTKLAAGVWDHLSRYRSTIPNFPTKETCELLIVDRSVDQISPVIHEWFYDAMCHDLLNLEGSKFVYEVPSKLGGSPVKKEAILEDHDPLWLELRHVHIADASERLHDRMTNFISKNKAAQLQNGRDGGELSTKDMQKMVQALPEYSDQMDKLSLHVEIAGRINNMIRDLGLRDLGQLEQDLVFGDAGAKELINFLRMKQDANREDMLRLLMIYGAVYPDKMDGDKGSKLMQLARLSPEDTKAVKNMRYLAGSNSKKATGGTFTLKFDMNRKKHSARKERQDEGETWALSRFYPMIEELIEKLSKGELSNDEYSCMNDLGVTSHETSAGGSGRTTQSQPVQSVRARRGAAWAKTRSSGSYSSGSFSSHSSNDFKNMGQRIFIFIIGGATRSELRSIHRLTSKLKREVVLGSSNICDPVQFITKLKLLNAHEVSLSNLRL